MSERDRLRAWFVREVLPHEAALTRFLRRNWRTEADIVDLRQETYMRVYEAAAQQPPLNPKPFLFATARNILVDRARRARIVSFELVADLEWVDGLDDALTPERVVSAREELRVLQKTLAALPRRCREVIELRKIHGLSQRDTASRLGISLHTVEFHTTRGMRALANAVLRAPAAAAAPMVRLATTKDDEGAGA